MTELGNQLLEGMQNALAYAQGQTVAGARKAVIDVPTIDVRALRQRLNLTQQSFAATFGFSLSSVRNWEQGSRRPEKSARILLAVIDRHPEAIKETLAGLEQAS